MDSTQKCYMGIDPGSKGFITIQFNGDFSHFSIADNDFYHLSDIMSEIKRKYPNIVCVMEDVHALFGSSAKSTFSFGEINGVLKGLLMANKIPYHLVQPKIWQKEIWENGDEVYEYKKTEDKKNFGAYKMRKQINTKQTSFNAAKRIFPTIDLRRTPKCSKLDDNKCDSLLICEYARRKNL